jgi:hypothetical protein
VASGQPQDDASWVALYLENFTVRLPQNPTNGGIDTYNLPWVSMKNIRVDVTGSATHVGNGGNWTVTEPTTTTSYGIRGPSDNLPAGCIYENVTVVGFYNGIQPGELWRGDNLNLYACKWPLVIPQHTHAGQFGYILVCNSPNTIKVTGVAEANIALLDIEHDTSTGGSGPTWVEPFGVDIEDPNNYLRGRINFHMHDTGIPFSINGAGKVQLHEANTGYSSWPVPEIFGGFKAQASALTVSGRGTSDPAWTLLSNAATTGNIVGIHAFANTSVSSGEKRIAQFYVQSDSSAANSGTYYFATSNAGTLSNKWMLYYTGGFYGITPNSVLGYGTGAGGTVTQATSRTTGVTINKPCGAITLVSAAGSTSWQTFTVTNSQVGAADTIQVSQKSGTDKYMIHVTAVGAGSFAITFATTGGTTTEQPVFNFTVLKGATS